MRAWEFITRRAVVGGVQEPKSAGRGEATVRSNPPQQLGRAYRKQADTALKQFLHAHNQPRRG